MESVDFYLNNFPDGVYVIPATLLRNQLIAREERERRERAQAEGGSAQESSSVPSAVERGVLAAQVPCPYCAEEGQFSKFVGSQSCFYCAEPLSSEDLAALEVIATQMAK